MSTLGETFESCSNKRKLLRRPFSADPKVPRELCLRPIWHIRLWPRFGVRSALDMVPTITIHFPGALRAYCEDTHDILATARALGKRTIIGGPYASSQSEILPELADHVVVGEPDEVFYAISAIPPPLALFSLAIS